MKKNFNLELFFGICYLFHECQKLHNTVLICLTLSLNSDGLNPNFMRDIFKLRLNQVLFGKKSIGPKLWNTMLYYFKTFETLES